MSAPDWALELSENANAYTQLGPRDERIVDDRYDTAGGPSVTASTRMFRC